MDIKSYRDDADSVEAGRERGWRYDEWKPCGVDYTDVACASSYDSRHDKFRDYTSESNRIIELLDLRADQTVIDVGCGTGAFAVRTAGRCKKIYAVDVSEAMLDCARKKVKEAKLTNVEFYRGGFLTYEHVADRADAIVSMVALHHLPDFWKLVGLKRLARMCKPGGKFYLFDVVFSFDVDDYESRIEQWIESTAEAAGPPFDEEVRTHVRDEYSTFNWVMEGLLERAGFAIETADYKNDFMAAYLCTRKG
jgi:putative AdoMet-dependent methyltransferase